VLAVKADYESGQATIGTKSGEDLSTDEILAALAAIGYRAEFPERSE
jgi:hypothetical protein